MKSTVFMEANAKKNLLESVLKTIHKAIYNHRRHFSELNKIHEIVRRNTIFPASRFWPAGNIDVDFLNEQISEFLSNITRVGRDRKISFIPKTYFKSMEEFSTYSEKDFYYFPKGNEKCLAFLNNRYKTYFPASKVDNDISKWQNGEFDSVETRMDATEFINMMYGRYKIFPVDVPLQYSFLYIDSFFYAMEKRVRDIEYTSKRDEEYLYDINPEFFHTELVSIFRQMLAPPRSLSLKGKEQSNFSLDDLFLKNTMEISIQNLLPYIENLKEHPLTRISNVRNETNLLSVFNESIDQWSQSKLSYKIYQSLYPLYIFLFNNQLIEQYLHNNEPYRPDGCTTLWKPNDDNLGRFLKSLRFDLQAYKRKRDSMERRKNEISARLYALTLFIYFFRNRNFSFTHKPEVYRTVKTRVPKEITVYADSAFTLWMLLKYSDLLHIILIHDIERVVCIQDKTNDILKKLPRRMNVFSLVNMNDNVLEYYPEIFTMYTELSSLIGEKIYECYKNLPFSDWLMISNQISDLVGSHGASNQILSCLLAKVSRFFGSISLSHNFVSFDEERFNEYHLIYDTIREQQSF